MCREAAEVVDAFSAVGIDYLSIGPYDSGGCTCAACAPWGVNGYLKTAEPIARLFRQRFPHAKVVLSTWYFDHFTDGEWDGLAQAFRTRPEWVDFIMADDYERPFPEYPLVHGVPGGLPMISFPEITMFGATPWGGFGANPFPLRLQQSWDTVKRSLSGGMTYSEGIFEDINKVVCAGLFWQQDRPASAIVREYAAAEYSPEVAESVSRAIGLLEPLLPRQRHDDGPAPRFVLQATDGIDEAYDLLERADAALSTQARTAWRWRILCLRALIDRELVHSRFTISAQCEEALQELTRLYYADQSYYFVSPPTRAALRAHRFHMPP
jgi:hypothetical protein